MNMSKEAHREAALVSMVENALGELWVACSVNLPKLTVEYGEYSLKLVSTGEDFHYTLSFHYQGGPIIAYLDYEVGAGATGHDLSDMTDEMYHDFAGLLLALQSEGTYAIQEEA